MAFQVTNPRQFYSVVALGIIILGAIVWAFAWGSGSINKTGEFTIEPGMPSRQVWGELKTQGFTATTLPWKYYSWRQQAAGKIQAGTYELSAGEKIKDVVRRFIAGDSISDEMSITFPEGFTLQQIAQRLAAKGIGTVEQFVALASDPEKFAGQFPFLVDLPAGRTLEGYLFPDTYRVVASDTPEDIIRRMLAAFDEKVMRVILPADAVVQSGRSLDQIVTMASILEREVQSDDDMAQVAGVLWKRFDAGSGLDADATIRYAVDKQKDPLTVQDLAIDSPYNTRKYRGLPPGPISSPGLRALNAALHPQASDYYYYLTASDGHTVFAKTLSEHNANKAKYLR